MVDKQQPPEFVPVNAMLCPACNGQNLSWNLECTWCGYDFIDEEIISPEEQKAGAA
jgi:hypothetical protein